jgi:DNA-dependent protein kinase catalytic subunit
MLELDAINTNPCMKMILQVISELHGSITPPPKEMAREEGSMPSWMRDMYKKMVDQSKLLHPGCSY